MQNRKVSVTELTEDGGVTNIESTFRNDYYPKRVPVVLRSVNIGSCLERWSWKYLQQRCGSRTVKVHVSPTTQMDFIGKNFAYRTLQFDDFLDRIQTDEQTTPFFSKTEKYYLRSVGNDPRKQVADIRREFPEVSEDIRFPSLFDEDRFFSSVFRIASHGIQLWTHYDVMDNMLMVVTGTKRVVLFDPKDALYLYLQGDKSQVLDVDNPDITRFPDFQLAMQHECILNPGDVLFIPALWFHNVLNIECGVAVNVFWKHLPPAEYDPQDTYGNKDLVTTARANTVLDRALRLLDTLPDEYRDFYARCMINKIQIRYNI